MSSTVQEAIDNDITREQYKTALSIYVHFAFPDDEGMQRSKMAWLDNPRFFIDGIPKEARFGCHVNGHMKLRCGFLNEDYEGEAGFWVDKNDGGDDQITRQMCREIKEEVEQAWAQAKLPVKPKKRRR